MLPNFVIGGAPKCGTSSAARWLADHPEVCMSQVKEPFYFMDPGHPLRRAGANYHDHGLARYGKYFENCPADARVRFEATTHYLYQQTARQVFADGDNGAPLPRVAFVLRKPAERVRSSFQYTKNNCANIEREVSFAQFVEAVLAGDEQRLDRLLSGSESRYVLKRDVQYSQYVDYVTKWKEALAPERVRLFLFENMTQAPRDFMRRLAQFCGVDPSFYRRYDFPHENRTYAVRSRTLHRWTRWAAGRLPTGTLKQWGKWAYLALQSGRKPKADVADEQALRALERHFAPYNRRLAEVTRLDVSVWNSD